MARHGWLSSTEQGILKPDARPLRGTHCDPIADLEVSCPRKLDHTEKLLQRNEKPPSVFTNFFFLVTSKQNCLSPSWAQQEMCYWGMVVCGLSRDLFQGFGIVSRKRRMLCRVSRGQLKVGKRHSLQRERATESV